MKKTLIGPFLPDHQFVVFKMSRLQNKKISTFSSLHFPDDVMFRNKPYSLAKYNTRNRTNSFLLE